MPYPSHGVLGTASVEQLALAYPDRDASLLRSVTRGLVCESCEKRKKAPRRPLVAMPKEPHFNYETGADLWYLRGQPVLHVICLFTRLRHCSFLRDKSAPHVCHWLLHLWVKYYGPPVLLYTDLGKEFDNEIIRMFAERYGITLHCAPGGSHWSLVFGLRLLDAPLHWYQALHKAMLSIGAIVVPFDLAIYLFRDHENLCGWAAVHVDDISIAGTDSLISSVLEALHSVFSVGSEKREEYVFCGVHLECKRDDDGNLIEITLDQQKYIDEIAEISLEESTDRGRLLNAKETTLYRGLIGAVSWCTGQTRPDFSYSVCRLSQRSSKPTVSDALQANKTLQHMRKRSLFIRFPKLSGPVRLIGYHDSSWGNGEEGKTVGGWLWTIASVGEDKKERFCLINWKSRTLRRVVKSTFAGETLACSACLDDLFLTLNVVTEITKMRVPVTLRTDCASLFDHVYLHKAVSEKRLLIELAVIRDAITSGEVTNLEWVATQDQLADALTKSGYSSIFYNSLNNAVLP